MWHHHRISLSPVLVVLDLELRVVGEDHRLGRLDPPGRQVLPGDDAGASTSALSLTRGSRSARGLAVGSGVSVGAGASVGVLVGGMSVAVGSGVGVGAGAAPAPQAESKKATITINTRQGIRSLTISHLKRKIDPTPIILHAFEESGRGVRRQAAYLVQAGVADHESLVLHHFRVAASRVYGVHGPQVVQPTLEGGTQVNLQFPPCAVHIHVLADGRARPAGVVVAVRVVVGPRIALGGA